MDAYSILKGVSLVSSMLFGGIILILTYEVAETGSFEDACIEVSNMIRALLRR